MNAPLPDLRRKNRAEPVPPETYRLVADIDATFEKKIFDLPQRQRIPDVHQHRQANYLGRTVEIAEGILHRCKLRNSAARLKRICSDTAHFGNSWPRRPPEFDNFPDGAYCVKAFPISIMLPSSRGI